MKKIIMLITALIILLPLNLKASDITANLTGPKEVTIGETFTVKYKINVPDIGVTDTKAKGIVGIMYYIDYNQDLLSLKSVTTNNYETAFINEEGTISVESLPKTNNCFDETTNCSSGTYEATLTFNILSKESTTGNIKITDPIIAILDSEDISTDILNGLSFEEIFSKAFKQSPNNFESLIFTINKAKEEDTRSSNNNLKSLEIQNYKIDFNKDTQEYEIIVSKEVNKVVVKAETEDANSRIIITGDDDLESNGNKVIIEVIAENEARKTYIISVKHKDDIEIINEEEKEKDKPQITSDKKILKLFGLIGGILIILIIIFTIKSLIKKKKINEMFNEL